MSNSSILPIDRVLWGATTPGLSEPGSDGNKDVQHIPQSSRITGASSSDYSVSYAGLIVGGGLTAQQRLGQPAISSYPLYFPIYIYIFWQHFFINTNFVEHNRHSLSTYFLLDPFVLPHCFYRTRRESTDAFSTTVYIPSTFRPTLGHHQGRIHHKSDVTFVFAYYCYVRASLPLEYITFAFKWVSINSVSSLRHLSALALEVPMV